MSCKNPEETGIFLNAISCKSKYDLQPAYYDISLNGKISRDEESSDMPDIMFANRVFDIGMFANCAGITDRLKTMLSQDDRNFASAFQKTETSAEKKMQTFIDDISALEY